MAVSDAVDEAGVVEGSDDERDVIKESDAVGKSDAVNEKDDKGWNCGASNGTDTRYVGEFNSKTKDVEGIE